MSCLSSLRIKNIRRLWRYALLWLSTLSLCIACNSSGDQVASELPTLTVGNSPWPGFVAQFVAEEKGFYAEEGIAIDEKFLQVSTDVNTALAGDNLEDTGITLDDLDLRVMPAAEAATAFAAGQVEVAIIFEPWLTTAVKEGDGGVIFTSVDVERSMQINEANQPADFITFAISSIDRSIWALLTIKLVTARIF